MHAVIQVSSQPTTPDRDREQVRNLCMIGKAEVIEDLLVSRCTSDEATVIILRLRVGLPNNAPISLFSAGCSS